MINRFAAHLGGEFLHYSRQVGRMSLFLLHCLWQVVRPPYRLRPILRQVYFIGARSMVVILVTGAFTGMVLALQGYHNLSKFGSEDLLGSAVGLGLIQELGPVLTALMVIGRAGSAICAEIGIMRYSEQIDALECMGIDPYKYLMAPKYVAALISLPLLTVIFDVIGILGGYVVGVVLMGVSEGSYFQGMYRSVEWADVQMGMVKSVIFGVLIVWISAFKGYFLHLNRGGVFGAEGVSQVTTDAVVLASVTILGANYLVGTVLLL